MIRLCFFLLFTSFFLNAQVVITEVHYDTPFYEGSPRDSPRETRRHLGEYIELYNFSSEDIPLKNWFITDRISKYTFPDDAVIPAEDFIILAYNDPSWYESSQGYNAQNYFTTFFPNTIGKESQIYYQGSIILRNTGEPLNLFVGMLRGTETNNDKAFNLSWEHSSFYSFNDSVEATTSPTTYNFYSSTSIHLTSNGSFVNGNPSPLSADYVPQTQDLEDIQSVLDALYGAYSNFTWEDYSDNILFCTCSLTLNVIEQAPYETYTGEKRCFEYDISGNKITSYDCSNEEEGSQEGNEQQIGFTSEELEEIDSKIIISPNPTNTNVNIQWDESINGIISNIQVLNQGGVFIGGINVGNLESSVQIFIGTQPTGIYIVSFGLNTGQIISRNVIKI